MSLMFDPQQPPISELLGNVITAYYKSASAPETSHALAGRLYLSKSGWILLAVPNSIVRGAFDALDEPGVELPPSGPNGTLNAHISVIRPEELEQIGGGEKITERGHSFRYNLGPIKTVVPAGWAEMSKVWFIEAHSPELQKLRKSYGLSGLPKEGKFKFHITVAVRRKGVLQQGDQKKAASVDPAAPWREIADCEAQEATPQDLREENWQPTSAEKKAESLELEAARLSALAGCEIRPEMVKEARSLLQKAVRQRLTQPFMWNQDAGITGNVKNYLGGIHQNFQRNVQQAEGDAWVRGMYNPQYRWQRLLHILETGDTSPEIQNPLDRLLYRWGTP